MNNNEIIEKEYSYKTDIKTVIFLLIVGIFSSAFGAKFASECNSIILWVITLLCTLCVVISVISVVHKYRATNRIAFTNSGIYVPAPFWSKGEKFHMYSGIESMYIETHSYAVFLQVKTYDAKFAITNQCFANHSEFQSCINLLFTKHEAHSKNK